MTFYYYKPPRGTRVHWADKPDESKGKTACGLYTDDKHLHNGTSELSVSCKNCLTAIGLKLCE